VYGVDISAATVGIAKRTAFWHGVGNSVSLMAGDCEALCFSDNCFDYVLSIGTLSCLDLSNAFSELARVLKPDGVALIVDTLGHNPLLNLNRRAKLGKGLKTEWSVKHILKLGDLRQAEHYFQKSEMHFFDLATLPLAFFRNVVKRDLMPDPVIAAAQSLDRSILRLGFLQQYAFKVVCLLSRPYKN
jgi:ubiquinone/menaquinone biosynthesis C-methylase UbiE